MTIIRGMDSAFGPSLATAQAAKAQGYGIWCGYLGGAGVYHTWTASEWASLRGAGLTPGAIWVPSLNLAEDPIAAADQADARATSLGIWGAIISDGEYAMSLSSRDAWWFDSFNARMLTHGRANPKYTGDHQAPPGAALWPPLWGSTVSPPPGHAVQYGGMVFEGTSVDLDLFDSAFPMASFSPPSPAPAPAPTPIPPVAVEIWTDPQEGPMQRQQFPMLVRNGEGWIDTGIPYNPVSGQPSWAGACPTFQGVDSSVSGTIIASAPTVTMSSKGTLIVETLVTVDTSAGVQSLETGVLTVYVQTSTPA